MADIRPAASLTSSLLARRGDARPAMRRQAIGHLHMPVAPQDDLGWNDIGDDRTPAATPAAPVAEIAPQQPAAPAIYEVEPPEAHDDEPASATLSPLAPQLEAIAERINQAPSETSFKPMLNRGGTGKRVSKAELAAARKAAFTLRIDSDRHLRLRLLSALANRSSQQLLIEALDALLSSHGEVEDLAGRVGKNGESFGDETGL
ncbi:MAG: hypothetical protein J7494_05980 [Sphingobium sp.]|nr:hypothetical protein [Sphingobium sp.]